MFLPTFGRSFVACLAGLRLRQATPTIPTAVAVKTHACG